MFAKFDEDVKKAKFSCQHKLPKSVKVTWQKARIKNK